MSERGRGLRGPKQDRALKPAGVACGRPLAILPVGGMGIGRGDVSPRGVSFFLSDQKETKESLGEGLRMKTLRLRLVFSLPIPQTP